MKPRILKQIASPAYTRWLDTRVLRISDLNYTRTQLNDMGLGVHTIAAARITRRLNGIDFPTIRRMGMSAFLDIKGIGEVSCIVMSHIIADQGGDVMKWIGAEGRTVKGAIANARAKSVRRKKRRSKE